MVGDHDHRLARQRLEQVVQQRALGDRIEAYRGLVQDDHGHVLQQHARERDAVALAAREAQAGLVHQRVQAVRQPLGHRPQPHPAQRVPYLVVGRVLAPDAQVVAQRHVEQVGALLDDPDPLRRLVAEVGRGRAAQRHAARIGSYVAAHEGRQRALARAAAAQHGHALALRHRQAQAAQHVTRRAGIAVLRPVNPHVERRLGHARGRLLLAGGRQVVQTRDGIAVGAGLHRRRRQGRERIDEREEAQHERGDPVGRVAPFPAEAPARPHQQQHGADAEQRLQHHVAAPTEALHALLHVAHPQLALLMAREVLLAAPGEHPVGHTQHVVGQLGVQLVLHLLVARLARGVRQHRHQRHEEHRRAQHQQHRQREPEREPAQACHQHDEQQPCRHRGEHGAQVQVLNVPDILGQKAQHVARAVRGAEEHGVALQRAVQLQPQSAGHAQHPVVAGQALEVLQDGLAHAEDAHEDERQVQKEDGLNHRRSADQVA